MDDLRERTRAGQTGTLEKILNAIPGYGGYRDKQLRRDADRLLREHIATELAEQGRNLPGLQRQLIDAGQLRLVDDLERVSRGLQTLGDQVRTAARGYSGFFDAVKVREAELDALYEFDQELLAEISHLSEGISALETAISAQAGIAEGIRDLAEAVDRLADYWRRRREAVLQI
jgi:HAMP domain-containing protein